MKVKTKFFVDVLAGGSHNESLLKMIASHNSGLAEISVEDMQGYIRCKAAEYPKLYSKDFAVRIGEDGAFHANILNIIEDGKYTLIIKEEEIKDKPEPVYAIGDGVRTLE